MIAFKWGFRWPTELDPHLALATPAHRIESIRGSTRNIAEILVRSRRKAHAANETGRANSLFWCATTATTTTAHRILLKHRPRKVKIGRIRLGHVTLQLDCLIYARVVHSSLVFATLWTIFKIFRKIKIKMK